MSQFEDRERLEGVYVSWKDYPPGGLLFAGTLFTVDRVNGNWTCDRVWLTPDMARTVVARLTEGLRLLDDRLKTA